MPRFQAENIATPNPFAYNLMDVRLPQPRPFHRRPALPPWICPRPTEWEGPIRTVLGVNIWAPIKNEPED